MKNLEISISNYWLVESQIHEARKVFFEKGIIKRELLDDELAFSWLRCKYKNISASTIPENHESKSKKIPIKQVRKLPLSLSEIWMGTFDEDNQLNYYTGNLELGEKFANWAFDEDSAGYNGIGYCLETNNTNIIVGFEHYNKHLSQYITIGFSYEKETVGIIIPLQLADDELIVRILENSFENIFDTGIELKDTPYLECYFFNSEIQVFNNCYKQFAVIASKYPYLKISTQQSYEANLLAREVHKNSARSQEAFLCLSADDPYSHELLECLDIDFKGTIYIEGCHWFSHLEQEKINDMIECKSINSKPIKGLYEADLAVFIFNKIDDACMLDYPEISPSLQSKYCDANLIIPSFKEIGHQFQSYLSDEFERLSLERLKQVICLSEETLKVLTNYSWPESYKELLYLVDYIGRDDVLGSEIHLNAIPDYILDSEQHSVDRMTIKYLEKKWIKKSLEKSKGNIKRTSEILGITRTTLYKKIKEYEIKV